VQKLNLATFFLYLLLIRNSSSTTEVNCDKIFYEAAKLADLEPLVEHVTTVTGKFLNSDRSKLKNLKL
jgi:hypothetical protein